jgi:hypothetical protein
MSEPYFVKGNAMGDERGQRRQGLGGINNACFKVIVVAPAGSRCTSHRRSRHPIANGCGKNNRERVVVVPVEGGGAEDVPDAPNRLGGSGDARFQAIVVAPAGCCCTSRRRSRHPIANGRVRDDGERVVVVPVEGVVPGDVVGDARRRRRQGCQIRHVDILGIFLRRGRGFFGCEMWPRAGKLRFFLGKEKLITPLIATPNVDKANRRQEERRKTKLALCVIRMQNGNGKGLTICTTIEIVQSGFLDGVLGFLVQR